jgi:hypothetical protein
MVTRGLKIVGWFAKEERRDRGEEVLPGAVFRKVRPDNLIETAKVLSVTKDGYGIPHVRYDLTFEGPTHFSFGEGERLLSVASFTERFPERVTEGVSGGASEKASERFSGRVPVEAAGR